MSAVCRRWFVGLAAAALALQSGCSLPTLAYFLMPEQRNEARMKNLAHKEEKHAPHVVILSHLGLETDIEMMHADRDVVDALSNELKQMAATYSEKVVIVPSRRVEEYKNTHPDWKVDLKAVGRHFNADCVVYLEFRQLSMRDRKLINMLTGKADLTIHLFEVNTDNPPMRESFSCRHPESRPADPIDADVNIASWREKFLHKVAKRLTPYFINHPRQKFYEVGE